MRQCQLRALTHTHTRTHSHTHTLTHSHTHTLTHSHTHTLTHAHTRTHAHTLTHTHTHSHTLTHTHTHSHTLTHSHSSSRGVYSVLTLGSAEVLRVHRGVQNPIPQPVTVPMETKPAPSVTRGTRSMTPGCPLTRRKTQRLGHARERYRGREERRAEAESDWSRGRNEEFSLAGRVPTSSC